MIKKLLFTLLLFTTLFSFSQFSLVIDGTTVTNNDVITVTSLGTSSDKEFIFTNLNTTMPINTLVQVESITNANGDHLTLCYNLCYFGVTEGTSYPLTGAVVIEAGASTATHGNHFVNEELGDDPTAPITYALKFYEVDNNGNEIGTPIRISYVYQPETVSVEDLNQVFYKLYPTVTNATINVIVNETVNLNFYDTKGKLVKQLEINEGNSSVDVSSLAKQLYFVVLYNQKGEKSLSKIIIK